MNLFTIGFTGKNARRFFELLQQAGVKRLIDIRLNNRSQLAGFTKQDDLAFFLEAIAGIEYLYLPELAPSKSLLNDYKSQKLDWESYQKVYRKLLDERRVSHHFQAQLFDQSCLLCSEHLPDQCHRRLAAEYLNQQWQFPFSLQHLR